MTKCVLLIEDDKQMQTLICDYLENFGYETEAYTHPGVALKQFFEHPEKYDVVILDLMLPQMDGFDVCKKIKAHHDTPVIISSARGDIGNKIHGYELGIDDYLAKPYEPRELILRIEAVLRRFQRSDILEIADFRVDQNSREVTIDDYTAEFTKVELDLFVYLLKNRQKAVSREQLIHASSLPVDTKNRTIDMHISNIRYKIGDDSKHPTYIKSVWGIGYKFIG